MGRLRRRKFGGLESWRLGLAGVALPHAPAIQEAPRRGVPSSESANQPISRGAPAGTIPAVRPPLSFSGAEPPEV